MFRLPIPAPARRLRLRTVALCVCTFTVTACSDAGTGPSTRAPELLTALPRALTVAEIEVVQSNNDFALRMLGTLAKDEPDSNLVISPLSISMALGMTMNGAVGETFDAMRGTLGFDGLTMEEVNESYRALIDLLLGLDPHTDTRIANSIWHDALFPVKPPFIDATRTFFDATVEAADFTDPTTVDVINAWVNEKTNGKIPKIIDFISPIEVMFLINAVYFKGTWRTQFDKSQTQSDVFTLLDGTEHPVQMMNADDMPGLRFSNELVDGIDLLYGNGAFVMTVLLPRPGLSVNAFIDSLDAERWSGWMENFGDAEMPVALPKWRLEWGDQLNTALKSLGMEIAFDSKRSDLSNISPIADEFTRLFITRVDHKTFIDVNESGTEAAAATSVGVGVDSAPEPFRVDRPFVFAIRERFSGTILFIGRVTRPVLTN